MNNIAYNSTGHYKDFWVLHVEDDPLLVELYKNDYKRYEIQYDLLLDPLEAIKFLKKSPNKYHLIVSDFHLPNMDGIDFLKNSFLINKNANTSFAILSSAIDDEIFTRKYENSGDTFIENVTLIDKIPRFNEESFFKGFILKHFNAFKEKAKLEQSIKN